MRPVLTALCASVFFILCGGSAFSQGVDWSTEKRVDSLEKRVAAIERKVEVLWGENTRSTVPQDNVVKKPANVVCGPDGCKITGFGTSYCPDGYCGPAGYCGNTACPMAATFPGSATWSPLPGQTNCCGPATFGAYNPAWLMNAQPQFYYQPVERRGIFGRR